MLKQIPGTEKLEFKEKFIERYKKITDFNKFKEHSLAYLRKSIRVNTLKISVNELKKRLEKNFRLEQIPWIKEGFYIFGERTDIGNLIEHSLGYFYVQEAASMIPAVVLDPKEDDLILDMAASPGSKTTHLAAIMKNKGLIIANDPDIKRLKALQINLQRCGVLNTIITRMNGLAIKNVKFDKILLDAPCSGTGAIRKSLDTINIYNVNMIKKLARMQGLLIENAYNLLNDNGILVYSTCSLEPEENEEVVDNLIRKYNCKIEKIKLNIKKSEAVLDFEGKNYSEEVKNCLRIWPQDNDTEGFFVAAIRKV